MFGWQGLLSRQIELPYHMGSTCIPGVLLHGNQANPPQRGSVTLDNHPDNHPLAGQKHIKLPALTSVGILGNDYYWIDGKGSITRDADIRLMPNIANIDGYICMFAISNILTSLHKMNEIGILYDISRLLQIRYSSFFYTKAHWGIW